MNALDIHNLEKTYANGFQALKGINLHVDQGDFFALLGPNGAGKSTLIGIVTSLIRKSAGQVSVLGHNIDTHACAAQSSLGVVTQEFNFNIYERVEDIIYNQAGFYGISRRACKGDVEFYLKKLALWDKRHQAASSLSGGMKRRLMVARALVHNPKLLILDEPTAGVDLEIRLAMWEFIQEINKSRGTTVILTTHYLEEAENLCNNVAVINHGNIIAQSSMHDFLEQAPQETVVLSVDLQGNTPPADIFGNRVHVIDSHTLEISFSSKHSIAHMLSEIEQCGIRIISMKNKASRLESQFLRLIKNGEDK